MMLLLVPEYQGQLTQTVGWGSAGSHGKRSSLMQKDLQSEEVEMCNSEALLVDDILLMIQVSHTNKMRLRGKNKHTMILLG